MKHLLCRIAEPGLGPYNANNSCSLKHADACGVFALSPSNTVEVLYNDHHHWLTGWLRRKLGETAEAPVYLHRVRGVGVKLVPPP